MGTSSSVASDSTSAQVVWVAGARRARPRPDRRAPRPSAEAQGHHCDVGVLVPTLPEAVGAERVAHGADEASIERLSLAE